MEYSTASKPMEYSTASKRPIKLRKPQLNREKKKILRKSKKAAPQPKLQEKDHGPSVPFCTFPRGYNPSPVEMADGCIGFHDMTPQEAQDWEEEKARERKNRFKKRVNLMMKLADSKKKYKAKLADAKKKEEAKLANAKKKEEAKLADAKKEEAKRADSKKEEEAKLADAEKEEEAKLADAKKEEEAKLADAKKEEEAKLADAKKEEEAKLADAEKEVAKLAITKKTDAEILSELDRLEDDRNTYLLQPGLTWEQKVVEILQMVRCRELTEYNHKLGCPAHTRFCCLFNIAFFDLDKESKDMPWEPIDKIPSPRHLWLADSVNIIAIKVAQSDMGYPISVFGTVLARDEYDHRCVYLFKRGRDDPQVITSKDDTLTLMGPYRALAVSDHMHFEFHLKVKGDGDVDEDFSKGVLVHSAVCHSEKPVMTLHLYSCLSTVKFVFTPVLCALEASFVVILKGPSDFIGKVTAWTTGNEVNKIPVYNKEVAAGVEHGGSVVHGLVAVPEDEELVLRVCVSEHCEHEQGKCFQLSLGHEIDEHLSIQEPYELQVKISWRGVNNRRGPRSWGRPNMWGRVSDTVVLL